MFGLHVALCLALAGTGSSSFSTYTEPVQACVFGHNDKIYGGVSLEECKRKCSSSASAAFVCNSLDYFESTQRCYLSQETKLTQPGHYQTPCSGDYVDAIYLEKKRAPSTPATTSTSPTTLVEATTKAESSSTEKLPTSVPSVKDFIDGTCYADARGSRLLPHFSTSSTNTPEECKKICGDVKGFLYAGVQWEEECWCGNDKPPASKLQSSSQCNLDCTGDASQKCGGDLRMNIYKTGMPLKDLQHLLAIATNVTRVQRAEIQVLQRQQQHYKDLNKEKNDQLAAKDAILKETQEFCNLRSKSSELEREQNEVFNPVKWIRVFAHDTSGGLFSSDADALLKNSDEPDSKLFSILGQLEEFISKKKYFHLQLCYPDLIKPNFTPCNEWIQTSNPATEATITGFKPISLAFPGSSVNESNQCPEGEANPSTCPWMNGYSGEFSGLGISPRSYVYTFMDDVPNHINWWYAVGAKRFFSGTNIPGPHGTLVKKVELFIEDVGKGSSD